MILFLILLSLLQTTLQEPSDQKLSQIPGYPSSFTNRAFAGYLSTDSDARKLHYVFLESDHGANNTAPLMLWLNGGPGCASKIGFVMEISPYCLHPSQPYEAQDELIFNPFAWSNLTNLLFIDSPAGTGFSLNSDSTYQFNDQNTAKDNFLALKDFFAKFPFYSNSTLYLAGESYAGKYIPDLGLRIVGDGNKMKLKGILLGNPVLNLQSLQKNRVEWMQRHNFIDPQLAIYWERSCKVDPQSAGCQYFYERYEDLTYRIDEYNIYGECYGRSGPPQRTLAAAIALQNSPFQRFSKKLPLLNTKSWCSYDKGVENYLNINAEQLNSQTTSPVSVCNMTIFNSYQSDPKGSIGIIPELLKAGIKIHFYSGDWDDVVPFSDTIECLNLMNLRQQGAMEPWIINDQNAGFIRRYSYNVTLYQVKGAGHQVPMYQRERAFRMLELFIKA